MKKICVALLAVLFTAACATVQEAKNFANCKYTVSGVEVTDYDVNSLSFDVFVNITNLNKKHDASIKKFDGKLTMNDVYVADIKLEDIHIDAGASSVQKAHVTVPMRSLNAKLIGLVSMGSASVDYHITGTANDYA